MTMKLMLESKRTIDASLDGRAYDSLICKETNWTCAVMDILQRQDRELDSSTNLGLIMGFSIRLPKTIFRVGWAQLPFNGKLPFFSQSAKQKQLFTFSNFNAIAPSSSTRTSHSSRLSPTRPPQCSKASSNSSSQTRPSACSQTAWAAWSSVSMTKWTKTEGEGPI